MTGIKDIVARWVNIKVPREAWKRAKIAATQADKWLSDWVVEAINEKLEREGKVKL